MTSRFDYLEGRKFCVVFVKVLDPVRERVQLQCFRGRASVEGGRVTVVDVNGGMFTIPGTAQNNILPSDGTAILKDADYYCLVRTDDTMELVTKN
ncbi:MAG: hypothetical protein JXR77_11245 [Lentisphaeria bacterium]|nr:hypothetical protein [Lentisphaeria bacterium]